MSTPTFDRYIFNTADTIRYRFPTHTNELVMDRSEAEASEVFMVVLEPGEAPRLHSHDDTEQVFYVVSGTGTLQIGADPGRLFPVRPGDLVRIPRNTQHRIRCDGSDRMVYLSVDCFVDGRPAAEPTWESHVHAICKNNGWDFNQVRQ